MQRSSEQTLQVVKAGAVYFAIVFGVGFILGAIRTLWVVPRVGARNAELMEMPIMLVVTILAARWTVLRPCGVADVVSPAWNGLRRSCPDGHRRVWVRALGSRHFDQKLSRHARPSFGDGLLQDARGVRYHAASRSQKMRLRSQGRS